MVRRMSRPRSYQRCACGASVATFKGQPAIAVTMQVSTVGHNPRLRAPAATFYPCPDCIRLLLTKRGRDVRKAMAKALQFAAHTLARKAEKVHA